MANSLALLASKSPSRNWGDEYLKDTEEGVGCDVDSPCVVNFLPR